VERTGRVTRINVSTQVRATQAGSAPTRLTATTVYTLCVRPPPIPPSSLRPYPSARPGGTFLPNKLDRHRPTTACAAPIENPVATPRPPPTSSSPRGKEAKPTSPRRPPAFLLLRPHPPHHHHREAAPTRPPGSASHRAFGYKHPKPTPPHRGKARHGTPKLLCTCTG
jgi:hypothetical protein